MTRDIIDIIDGSLADNAISGDAMRWTPEPPITPRALSSRHHIVILAEPLANPEAPTVEELAAGNHFNCTLPHEPRLR